jgi:hypothetical protein
MAQSDVGLETSWVPGSCSLPTADQPLRVAEFDGLFASAVEMVERTSPNALRLTLRPDPDVAATTAQLAAHEVHCCGFFTFTLTLASLSLILHVAVPDSHIDVLDGLQTRAAQAQV